ncbi:ribonuclease YeeF family protein [Listeria monocytogenes]|nr:ribonuclease YeeF family protein [Listeria monocytogenes]MBH0144785.1 ribonuclease YeeF family protein [Listeria monocytogenes]MCM9011576.1 ribonuclease YeeF family protein [Listeria monocytogenes]MCM9020080.1 ribonuclease YeeF family protein [Listeria monocytogenes]MCM9046568.1 ribonuclease YeeF family protein [Listeria monocytogenes]
MKEVNYREDDWREAKSALAPFAAANWVGGLFNNLEKVSKNMEEAEEDIQELDSDHAISFQHTNYRGKYSAIEDDLMVLYKFSCHAGEKMETLVDQPFYEKLDAFVDGMQDLSISTYSTTNRIGAKSKQTYMSSYGNQPQVIESVKDNATIEDLMNGDNFYANQMQLQYRDWQRANPDQDVSKKDFQMGMLHSRAFEYKSIKDEQQEKEFWVNIVATVVIVGVSIFCPPAGLALAVGYGSLEAGSAISGKDWVSGRELSAEERALRGGLALLDIVPGVKALSTGAKAASAGSKLVRVGDNVLAGSKNVGKGTIDNGIQAGKQAMDLRLANAKKVSEAVQKKLTKDLDDIGTMAKTIQNKTKETFTLPPREQLAFAGGGSISEQSAAGAASIAAKKKLKDIMQNMDNLNVKGGGKAGIIEGAENSGKYLDDIEIPDNMKKWDYPPSKELFKKYEEVYKNPKYYNQETGAINWPPNNGFIGETHERLANVGEFFDRYGEPSGEFLAKSGFSFEERALAPHSETSIYYKYRVEKPFKIIEGETAPWFDQKGGATQLYGITEDGTVLSVEQLIDEEYLELVN